MSATTTLKGDVELIPVPNPVLTNLVDALETYADTYIEVEIYDVNPPGSSINEGESVPFKIRARNKGPMHVDDLALVMTGRNGCRVGLHGWSGGQINLTTDPFPRLRGKMGNDEWVDAPISAGHYHLFAGGPVNDADLLEVTVDRWNADWGYILVNRSLKGDDIKATYNGDVLDQ